MAGMWPLETLLEWMFAESELVYWGQTESRSSASIFCLGIMVMGSDSARKATSSGPIYGDGRAIASLVNLQLQSELCVQVSRHDVVGLKHSPARHSLGGA
jgi:hypothetical protein